MKDASRRICKSARRIDSQNEYLREHWITDLLNLTAKQLVFVDELLFNEIIDWRLRAYALIDQSARYRANIIRGRLWSVLSAYTSNDKFFVSLSDLYLFVKMIEIKMLSVRIFSSYSYT